MPGEIPALLLSPSCFPVMTSAWERENRKWKFRGTSVTRSSKMAACWLPGGGERG